MTHALPGSPRCRAARLAAVSPGRAKVTTNSSDSKVSGAGGASLAGPRGRPAGGGRAAQPLVALDRLLLALEAEDPERAGLDDPPHLLVRPPADQDLPRPRLRLEPGRPVHAVPDHRVLHLVLGADRAGDDLARAEADADSDRGLALEAPLLAQVRHA